MIAAVRNFLIKIYSENIYKNIQEQISIGVQLLLS